LTTETAPPPAADAQEGTLASLAPQPTTIEETGLELSLLVDLTLKSIYFLGRPSARQLADQLALSLSATEELVVFLRQEQTIEVVGSMGVGEQAYQYALTERGRRKAEEALRRSQYVGAAPVPFESYIDIVMKQSVSAMTIDHEKFRAGVSHLVLGRKVLASLGPAINSARSLLLYGRTGNGKSSITMAIGQMLPGRVLIPHAVEVHGQIVKVFDPRVHRRIQTDVAGDRRDEAGRGSVIKERRQDRRWVLSMRPLVSVGGELTLEDLELRYSPISQFYIAPLQWKANNGVLIIDDFGRQMIKPQALLNRWIVPMEQGMDHLSMHTGDTLELPFEILLIFSSNIPPGQLGDEAFFRRIRHKVEIPDPSFDDYIEILRRVCDDYKVRFEEDAAAHLLERHYKSIGREPRACHPRDIVELLLDITRFYNEEPKLSPEWIDLACASYFVDTGEQAA
jgi:predicted ATPase with chaperone activity